MESWAFLFFSFSKNGIVLAKKNAKEKNTLL